MTWPVCPGGTDFAAAEELGLHAEHALALPGRCAPQTAGALIAQTVLAILEERDPDERSHRPMTTQSKRTVAFALCGSFCSFAAVLPQLRVLTARGWDVLPVLSASAAGLDTRFGTASALRQTLYEVTGHRPLTTLQAVEPLGPQRLAEALIIAPATGTTMALLAAGISSTPRDAGRKSLLRGRTAHYLSPRPRTMGFRAVPRRWASFCSGVATILVPFGQDDSYKKPCSLKSDFTLLPDTLEAALRGVQIQPLLL